MAEAKNKKPTAAKKPVKRRRLKSRSFKPLAEPGSFLETIEALRDGRPGDDHALRADILAAAKTYQSDTRAEARRRLEARESNGIGTARSLSHAMDVMIADLATFAQTKVFPLTNPTKAERLSIAAIGGYGRGELAPGSDIDLLFLLPHKQTPWGEQVVEYLLYLLWDLGLKVGHATRTIADCVRLSKTDVTICTSLLEARPIWGDEPLYEEFKTKFWSDVVSKGKAQPFVDAKLAERDQRHDRLGENRYRVEPHLKEGKGGLRDLQTLWWIGKYVYSVEEARDLVDEGVLTATEYRRFAKAEEFFMAVRCHIHFITDRAEERVTFDLQPELAERLGYTDRAGVRGVERFMKHYFLCAKDVGDLTRIFCAVLEETSQKSRTAAFGRFLPKLGKGNKAETIGDFTAQGGRLAAANDDVFDRDPVNLIRIFAEADNHDLDIHPATLRLITRSLKNIDAAVRKNPEANQVFLDILTESHDPEKTLRRMNEAGVFGKFVPIFGRVVALMQFNMYHHYTVDEHSIQAIGTLAAIERGEMKDDHPTETEVIKKVVSRKVLYVAMMLHDIAKGRPGDHSEVGAELARRFCPRLGFSKAETETAAWLVRVHLVMSNIAQKRDVADPRTIDAFADIIQSPERLRLLLCLTIADMRATAPNVWNAWKGQLLRDLYNGTMAKLSGADPTEQRPQMVAKAKHELHDALKDWSEDDIEAYVKKHGTNYWLSTDEGQRKRHAEMIRAAEKAGESLTVDTHNHKVQRITEVSVYCPDHPGVFAKIAGGLSVAGANIVDAKGFITSDGKVLDVFWVQNKEGGAIDEKRQRDRLRDLIDQALADTLEIKPAIVDRVRKARTKRAQAFSVAPQVLIDNQASEALSVIEIHARDRAGLLHDLAQVFFEQNLTIASAHVATFGERAVDVFYVKDLFGSKVTHLKKLQALEAALLSVVDPLSDKKETAA